VAAWPAGRSPPRAEPRELVLELPTGTLGVVRLREQRPGRSEADGMVRCTVREGRMHRLVEAPPEDVGVLLDTAAQQLPHVNRRPHAQLLELGLARLHAVLTLDDEPLALREGCLGGREIRQPLGQLALARILRDVGLRRLRGQRVLPADRRLLLVLQADVGAEPGPELVGVVHQGARCLGIANLAANHSFREIRPSGSTS
jgi:hypothetical protein